MSIWQAQQVEERVVELLAEVPLHSDHHQLGRPFMTVYQLAIMLDERYPS